MAQRENDTCILCIVMQVEHDLKFVVCMLAFILIGPIPKNMTKIRQKLRDTDKFGKNVHVSGTPEMKEEASEKLGTNSKLSSRRIETREEINSRLVWRTRREQLLYLYQVLRLSIHLIIMAG